MKIEWAIWCQGIEVDPGGGTATIKGVGATGVITPSLPANVSVLVAVKVVAQPHEVDQAKRGNLAMRVVGPGLEDTNEHIQEVDIIPNRFHSSGIDSFRIIQMTQVFEAFAVGDYTIMLSIDESTWPLSVYVSDRRSG